MTFKKANVRLRWKYIDLRHKYIQMAFIVLFVYSARGISVDQAVQTSEAKQSRQTTPFRIDGVVIKLIVTGS